MGYSMFFLLYLRSPDLYRVLYAAPGRFYSRRLRPEIAAKVTIPLTLSVKILLLILLAVFLTFVVQVIRTDP